MGGFFHVVQRYVVLAQLEIDIGAGTFQRQIVQQHFQISGSPHPLVGFTHIAFMIKGEGNGKRIGFLALHGAYLLMNAALVMAVVLVEEAADAL